MAFRVEACAAGNRSQPANEFFESRTAEFLFIFVAAKKFVALDRSYDPNCALIALFRAVHAAEAADTNRSCQGDLVRESHQNLNW